MRTVTKVALGSAALLVCVVAACGCSLLVWSTRSPRDWQAIQSVGGMELGTPYRDESGDVSLPINCDVTRFDSALNCASPAVRVRAQSIYLTARTELAHEGGAIRCPDAELGELPGGAYSVFYASPDGSEHPLGSVEVPGRPSGRAEARRREKSRGASRT